MTREALDALREGWDLEAKEAQGRHGLGAVPRSFWETYSAMANTAGGRILLGVGEGKDHTLEVIGIGDPQKVLGDLWSTLEDRKKVSANILSRRDVRIEQVGTKAIVVVDVPRAPRGSRPIYINDDLWSGTFVRHHEGDFHAERDRIRRMVADTESDSRDVVILRGYTAADLDQDSLSAYRNVFSARKPNHPWLEHDQDTFLRQLGAVRRDRETGEEGLTLAGLLMFGAGQALREARPHFILDYQERGLDAGAIEWVDRVMPDGTWSGNLYDFVRKVIPRLFADLKVPFELDGGIQRRDETHVHEALREALVNALIHADYDTTTPTLVIKRPDGFEFRNPGTPRLSIEAIRAGGVSDCRNRTLQTMFALVGMGETAGSGFSRIQRAWREQSWRTPGLRVDMERETTTLALSTESLLPPRIVDRLRSTLGEAFTGQDETGRLILVTAAAEGAIDHARICELSSAHGRDITLKLQDLMRKGLLYASGRMRQKTYSLPETGHALQGRLPFGEGEGSPPSDASSQVFDHTSSAVSEILAACRGRFQTTTEIAAAVRRSAATVRRYLPRLVAQGLLDRMYPDRPRHPGQAYRTVEEGR
ncbi:MAG: putative DNA binding domain-containing protein [Myxococcales bacterium]|nr:putative DNA binding domain-containing protein [Myxococcales bacterium]